MAHIKPVCKCPPPTTARQKPTGSPHPRPLSPKNPEDYRLAAIATRDHVDVTFKSDEGGRTAHYLLRWVNTRGETGPWSPVFSGTIPAV